MKIGIFISGTGSNMETVIRNFQNGTLDGVSEISFVLSDKKNAGGIEKAQKLGIQTVILPKMKDETRENYELRLYDAVKPFNTGLIVLAGFMKIIGSSFMSRYKGKIINIHPSLLPSFKGVDAQKQAFDYGVKISGCTVHFVDETLDGGPIILQKSVERHELDTVDDFKHRILDEEHRLLSKAISIVAQNNYTIKDRLVSLERR
ncbi:MAG TPA: phosphoribosylglycinamide formyltransferase [bacterium]|nr:phosphoribosylglycinamide formyltransferase [bacterium]HPS29517.1 phosphoribosylglycinamide formyltransferase [bacterium]